MASAPETNIEDIVKCPICLEVYKTPKYLPCLHTFCEPCIHSSVVSLLKENGADSNIKVEFKCPICRVPTPVQSSSCSPKEWANRLPTNHLIITLMDKNKLQSNAKLCDPCQSENVDVTADSWCKICNEAMCEVCAKHHRKLAATKQHKLFTLSEIDTNELDITRHEYCEIHHGELLVAFCIDHDEACCVTCATINHRKCDHVTTLREASEGIRDKLDIKNLSKRLQESEEIVSQMLTESKQNSYDIEAQKLKMMEAIKKVRRQINDHFNDLESKLTEDIKTFQKQYTTEINDHVYDLENKYKIIMSYRKILNICLQHASDIHLFLESKRLTKKTKEMDKDLKSSLPKIGRIDSELHFTPEIKENLSINQLGMVEVKKSKVIKTTGHLSRLFSRVLVKHASIPFPKSVQSALFLPYGGLIVAMEKSCVFCDDKGENQYELNDDKILAASELKGITMYSNKEALLARPSNSEVYKVDINRKQITQTWKSSFCCYNIASTGDGIVAACRSKLVVMNLEGNIVKEISVPSKVDNITSHNNIVYYTNRNTGTVCAMSLDGNKIFEYSHPELREPRGVTTDTDGLIYVAGYESSNVHQILPDGQLVKILLTKDDGIKRPDIVCFSIYNNKFLVSHSDTQINVYEKAW